MTLPARWRALAPLRLAVDTPRQHEWLSTPALISNSKFLEAEIVNMSMDALEINHTIALCLARDCTL